MDGGGTLDSAEAAVVGVGVRSHVSYVDVFVRFDDDDGVVDCAAAIQQR